MSYQVASYRRILKTSPIIGWASVINIVIGLVCKNMLAVLLGPTGKGLGVRQNCDVLGQLCCLLVCQQSAPASNKLADSSSSLVNKERWQVVLAVYAWLNSAGICTSLRHNSPNSTRQLGRPIQRSSFGRVYTSLSNSAQCAKSSPKLKSDLSECALHV